MNCLPPNGNGTGGNCVVIGNDNCGSLVNGGCCGGNGNWLSLHSPHVLLQTSASIGVKQLLVEMVMQMWESSLQGLLGKWATPVNLKIPFKSIWRISCHF